MSARDAESGSSSYKGGSGSAGGVGNGGLGGGMGGGGNWGMGGSLGGAARNGGYAADRTGMYTGAKMYGNTAFGRPGQAAYGYGTRLTNGMMTDFRMPNGMRPQTAIQQGPLNRAAHQRLLGNPVPAAVAGVNPVPENVPLHPAPYPPTPYFKGYGYNPVDNIDYPHPNEYMGSMGYSNPSGFGNAWALDKPYNPATSPPQPPTPYAGLMPTNYDPYGRIIDKSNYTRVKNNPGVDDRYSAFSGYSNSGIANPNLGTPGYGGGFVGWNGTSRR